MKHGFTLIELLTVILIVGILAAVALPYYQNAVQSARNTEAVVWWGQLKRFNAGKNMTAERAQRYENQVNDNGKLKHFTVAFFCRTKDDPNEPCWELELRLRNPSQHIQYFLGTQNNMQQLVCVPLNGAAESFCQSISGQEEGPDAVIEGQDGYLIRS